MVNVNAVLNYILYLIKSTNQHGLHSPFSFDFATKVIYNRHSYYAYKEINALVKSLRLDHTVVEVLDYGAGSKMIKGTRRKISSVAKSASKEAKYGQLLFRMINYLKPKVILELGTCLGVSTSYLARPNSAAQIITMEGCPNLLERAKTNLRKLHITNVHFVKGDFNQTLNKTLESIESLDFVFFDGNHKYEPTLDYFNQCLAKKHEKSVFVFDDINWSGEMKKAWGEIKSHPSVTVSMDLFQFGIVFFNSELKKQDYIIRY